MIIQIHNQVNQMAMAIPEVMAIPEEEFDVPRTTSTMHGNCYETDVLISRKESASTVVVQEESVQLCSRAARLEIRLKGLKGNYRYQMLKTIIPNPNPNQLCKFRGGTVYLFSINVLIEPIFHT